jgi:hypothetical protein
MRLKLQDDGSYTDLDLLEAGTPNCYPKDNHTVLKWLENNTAEAYVAPVKTWEENRQEEYPTIEELVVALYDTDDKAAIEKRRSDVKAKYPKPE